MIPSTNSIFLLTQCQQLVPGFSKAIAFVYHPTMKRVSAYHLEGNESEIMELETQKYPLDDEVVRLRMKRSEYEWVQEGEIPFKVVSTNAIIKQMEIFDELKQLVLLFRVANEQDGYSDLLYLFFQPNASNFGIRNSTSQLSTDQKSVVAQLLVKTFKNLLNIHQLQQNQMQELRKDIQLIEDNFSKERHTIVKISGEHQKQISNYILSLLQNLADHHGFYYKLSTEALEYINQFKGDISVIPSSIEKAFQLAIRIQNPSLGNMVNIELYHIQIGFGQSLSSAVNMGIEHIVDTRFQNTIRFLNRMEQAAKKLQMEGKNFTGTSLGQAMNDPISAPAISDALKKRKQKIQYLFKEFPHEWELLRAHFKPIQNTLSA